MGNHVRQYVRRSPGEEFDPTSTVSTIKGGGGKVNVWACMTSAGPGPIARIEDNIDQQKFKEILVKHLKPWIPQRSGYRSWVLQQDNDPKHTAKSVKTWLQL